MEIVSRIGLVCFLVGVVFFLFWIIALLVLGNDLSKPIVASFPYLNANRLMHLSTFLLVCGFLMFSRAKKSS